ncbi:MAG: B12-binding domain-containing radical SAM protein [Vulcanimicrobiota bacterium]
MKIGLIEACDPNWQFRKFSYPLQLGYLASFILKHRPNDEIVIAEELTELLNAKPDIIGISSYSINYDTANNFAGIIKDRLNIPVILGGCHISALPETLKPVFDAAVLAEGEETFLELIQLYDQKEKFESNCLENINGLAFFKDGEITTTQPRPLIQPLSKIPPPPRNLFVVRSGTHYISTSRGCPFQCLFCAPRLIWGQARSFPANYVLKEIGEIVRNFSDSFTHLMIVDDLFVANRKRLKELRDKYVKTGLNQVIQMQGNVRSDLVDEELVQILKDLNFTTVSFGAESGSDRILEYYRKNNTVENNQKTIDLFHKYGIETIPSFIIGAPVETADDLDKTIAFIEKNHGKMFGFEVFPLIPMPGTPLWQYAIKKGIVGNNMEWARLEPRLLGFEPDEYIFLIENISKKEFLEYVEKFKNIYVRYNPDAMAYKELLEQNKKFQ